MQEVADHLALEVPLSIRINGEAFTLTMQTPGAEEDLARGLLFTEGVYRNTSVSFSAEVGERNPEGWITALEVRIPEAEIDRHVLNKRSLLSVASCGICGKIELTGPSGSPLHAEDIPDAGRVHRMFRTMQESQEGFRVTGGVHAAAVFDRQARLLSVREDIGRHNAVDKVVGDLLNRGVLPQGRYLLVSGRVSYEILTKCFAARIPYLFAVSAPSSLAVDFARELGITLGGFCREDRITYYSVPASASTGSG